MSLDEPSPSTQQKSLFSGIFDRAAPTYDQIGPRFFTHFGQRLVALAQIPKGAHVLDVATGRGAVLFPAAAAVGAQGRVIGVDLAPTMVQETAKVLAAHKLAPNVAVMPMDAEALQFPDASFDTLLCGFSLFFFPQLDRALAEFRRVLKPQGRIGVTTWDKSFAPMVGLDEIVQAYLPPQPTTNPSPTAETNRQPVFDTPAGLEAILQSAGFTNIQLHAEAVDFVYADAEEFWTTLWSHGGRAILERIEGATGVAGLQRFQQALLTKLTAMAQPDGIHQQFPVLFALATNPTNESR